MLQPMLDSIEESPWGCLGQVRQERSEASEKTAALILDSCLDEARDNSVDVPADTGEGSAFPAARCGG